jgi:hypothetical protein
MTPAAGGEVDDLLEPVWSWPERTMLASTSAKGCPPAEPLAPSGRGKHGVMNQKPNPHQQLMTADPA